MVDLKNSLERLAKLLKLTRYPHSSTTPVEYSVADLLRILHHALLDYSRPVAGFILEKGYDLYGKTDIRFIDHCFRLMREEFQYFPSMNTTQFLSPQFLDRKLQLTADILEIVMRKHDACVRKRRQAQAVWTKPREPKSDTMHVENHRVPSPPPQPTPITTIDTKGLLRYLRQDSTRKAVEQQHTLHRGARKSTENGDYVRLASHEESRRARLDTSKAQGNNQSDSDSTGTDGDDRGELQLKESQRDHQHHSESHTDGSSEHCACGCSDTKEELHNVLATLSKQINDLSSAVVSRVSSIESRLDRVEQQLHALRVPPTISSRPWSQAQSTSAQVSSSRSLYPTQAADSKAQDSAASIRSRFKTSWPPDPDHFGGP